MKRTISLLVVLLSFGLMAAKGCVSEEKQIAARLFTEPFLLQAADAAERGDKNKLEAMKKSGFDINQQGAKDGSTLLIWAILSRNLSLVNLLLQEGADPNRVPKESYTAMGAASLEDQSFLKALLKAGGNPNLFGSQEVTPIFDAQSSDRWDNVWLFWTTALILMQLTVLRDKPSRWK